MRRMTLLCAALLLAGCHTLEANDLLNRGHVRIEPHPAAPEEFRVTFLTQTVPALTLPGVNTVTDEGRRGLLAQLIGPRCANAAMTEESRMPLAPGIFGDARDQRVYRVRCAA